MESYLLVKTLHILSSTILFGTGIGIAFFFLMGMRGAEPVAAWFAARTTAIADMVFTLNAGILQPLSGFALVYIAGHDPFAPWLIASYLLYLLALACWLPVVWLQLKMRDMLRLRVEGGDFDAGRFARYYRLWFALGWPAFTALVIIFYLMVARPAAWPL